MTETADIITLESLKKRYEGSLGALNNLGRAQAVLALCEKEKQETGKVTADNIIEKYKGSKAVVSPLVRLFKELDAVKSTSESDAPLSMIAMIWDQLNAHFRELNEGKQAELEKTRAVFFETADAMLGEIDSQSLKIKELELHVANLSAEADNLSELAAERGETIKELTQQNEVLERELQVARQQHDHEAKLNASKIKTLEDNVKNKTEEIKDLKVSHVKTLNDATERHSKELERLTSSHAEAIEAIKRLAASEKDSLSAELAELSDKNKSLEDSVLALKAENEDAARKLFEKESIERLNHRLKTALARAKEDNQSAVAALKAELSAELKSLIQDNGELKERLNLLIKTLEVNNKKTK